MDETKIYEIDLYELLGISLTSSEKEVKKAYRKKALTCHPDKNPDNPEAVLRFHQLSKALEILTDSSARTAYNKVLNGRKAAKVRHRELDSKRQKLKEDLEEREKAAAERLIGKKQYSCTKTDEEKLRDEIDRLRKEGSRAVEEEMAFVKSQVEAELKSGGSSSIPQFIDNLCSLRLKVNWKSAKDDEDNGGYSHDSLHKILSKYGDIVAIILSKKKGSAVVEFKTSEAASMAQQFEKGFHKNPVTVKYIGGFQPSNQASSAAPGATLVSDTDYESLVLRRMRQAQERKKLIDDIKAKDKII